MTTAPLVGEGIVGLGIVGLGVVTVAPVLGDDVVPDGVTVALVVSTMLPFDELIVAPLGVFFVVSLFGTVLG
ncbi:MAG: hypothetical protein JWL95_2152 [Gemmatimonadetes bacterium]|nr:hypothetical protein [Gemmatimonadota bacterium]